MGASSQTLSDASSGQPDERNHLDKISCGTVPGCNRRHRLTRVCCGGSSLRLSSVWRSEYERRGERRSRPQRRNRHHRSSASATERQGRARVPVSRGCRQEAEGRGGCGAMGNEARRMLGWAVGDSLVRGARGRPARSSGVPVMGRVLVERVLRDGLGSLEIEDRGLVEVELGLGGPRDRVRKETPRRQEYRRARADPSRPRWTSGARWAPGPLGSGVDGCGAAERAGPGARASQGW
jgi:hypothetical protein